jgi:hypothetical protein
VEEPVLERDAVRSPEDRAVDDGRRRLVGVVVALQCGEPVARRAVAHVIPAADEVGVGEEALDPGRRRPLARMQHDHGRVPREEHGRRGRFVFLKHKLALRSGDTRTAQNEPDHGTERCRQGEQTLVFLKHKLVLSGRRTRRRHRRRA